LALAEQLEEQGELDWRHVWLFRRCRHGQPLQPKVLTEQALRASSAPPLCAVQAAGSMATMSAGALLRTIFRTAAKAAGMFFCARAPSAAWRPSVSSSAFCTEAISGSTTASIA